MTRKKYNRKLTAPRKSIVLLVLLEQTSLTDLQSGVSLVHMAKLPKFTLEKNERTDRWDLRKDVSRERIRSFGNKGDATKGGVLERTVGPSGGSVKIQKANGRFQEERTYPGSKDPSKSKG